MCCSGPDYKPGRRRDRRRRRTTATSCRRQRCGPPTTWWCGSTAATDGRSSSSSGSASVRLRVETDRDHRGRRAAAGRRRGRRRHRGRRDARHARPVPRPAAVRFGQHLPDPAPGRASGSSRPPRCRPSTRDGCDRDTCSWSLRRSASSPLVAAIATTPVGQEWADRDLDLAARPRPSTAGWLLVTLVRHHLVGAVALVLALAVGIALGSGPLSHESLMPSTAAEPAADGAEDADVGPTADDAGRGRGERPLRRLGLEGRTVALLVVARRADDSTLDGDRRRRRGRRTVRIVARWTAGRLAGRGRRHGARRQARPASSSSSSTSRGADADAVGVRPRWGS